MEEGKVESFLRNLFAFLLQADGFPTLLFFPAGNKSFEPVSDILFLLRYLNLVHNFLFLESACLLTIFLMLPYIVSVFCRFTVDTDRQWWHSTNSSRSMLRFLSSSKNLLEPKNPRILKALRPKEQQ